MISVQKRMRVLDPAHQSTQDYRLRVQQAVVADVVTGHVRDGAAAGHH
jgi:hypothetical protein